MHDCWIAGAADDADRLDLRRGGMADLVSTRPLGARCLDLRQSPVPSVCVLGSTRDAVGAVMTQLIDAGHTIDADPDVVVLVGPGGDDWKAAAVHGKPMVLLYSGSMSAADVVTAVTRGVCALVDVDDVDGAGVLSAVESVAAGDVVLDAAQRRAVVDALRSHHHFAVTLTDRELDILRCVESGSSVKQTARTLGISPKTVENTQRLLFRKLGVNNRAQAVARARSLFLLAGDS